jgi:hypothetical protein
MYATGTANRFAAAAFAMVLTLVSFAYAIFPASPTPIA